MPDGSKASTTEPRGLKKPGVHWAQCAIAGICVLAVGGCQALHGRNLISPPGSVLYQQANATIHDPFPQGDIGHNDGSMRPPDYQVPMPPAVRNRMKADITPWLQD